MTVLLSFQSRIITPSLLTRKSLSPRWKLLSSLNFLPDTSGISFFLFFLAASLFFSFFFFGTSISGSSFLPALRTPMPEKSSSYSFLIRTGDVKKLSKKTLQNVPFSFSESCITTPSPRRYSVDYFFPVYISISYRKPLLEPHLYHILKPHFMCLFFIHWRIICQPLNLIMYSSILWSFSGENAVKYRLFI